MEMKYKNWRIIFKKSGTSGWLVFDGKKLLRWGGSTGFIIDKYSVRYDYPEVVPMYLQDKLEALRERIFA